MLRVLLSALNWTRCQGLGCGLRQASFEASVRAMANMASREYLHALAESRRIAQLGERAVAEHERFHVRVEDCESLNRAPVTVTDYLDQVAALASAKLEDIPILVIWNLNSLGGTQAEEKEGWKARANAFSSLLQARPNNTLGLIIHRKATSSCSRWSFHSAVATHLEKAGLDVDIDLSLGFNRGHGNNRDSLTVHGWLATCQGRLASSPWAGSALLAGSIHGLEQLRTDEMHRPLDPATVPYEGGARGGDVSAKQRGQALPTSAYERMLREAVNGLRSAARNKKNARVVVAVVVDNYDSSPVMAILNEQRQLLAPAPATGGAGAPATGGAGAPATGGAGVPATGGDALDIRGLIFPASPVAKTVASHAIKEQVYKWWLQPLFPGQSNFAP